MPAQLTGDGAPVNFAIHCRKLHIEDMAEEFDHTIKVVFTGNSGVGKSSMMLRFTEGTFNPDLAVTVGLDFKIHLLDAHSQLKIRLNIWDTAGQEKFHSLTGSYYRGAHGIFIVYSVAERASFDSLRSTLQEVDQHITKRNVVKVLVGNKIDLPGRQVSEEEGREFARAHGLYFLECSCKDDIHVNDAFETLVNAVLDRPALLEKGDGGRDSEKEHVRLEGSDGTGKGCCCSLFSCDFDVAKTEKYLEVLESCHN